jgi:arylsulfatase A
MKKGLAALALLAACAIGRVDAAPNIVIILADDLGWADLGCYGNTFNETPHIDRLATEGLRFTQFYAGPVCSPTRANLQSGQDQARFGITQHIPGHRRPYARLIDPAVPAELPLATVTFAESLGSNGYRTGYFGKWHLGGKGHAPNDQGWQTALETHGNTQPPSVTGSPQTRQTAEFLTEKAIAFIESNQAHLFLLQVSHAAVHIPLSTTPARVAKYQKKAPMPGYPSRPEYAGLLDELDQSVGAITATLDRLGLSQNTLLFFTSDNGGLVHQQDDTIVTSNHPLRSEKGTLYEGGIRVPAIARWPGTVPAANQCATPVITQDLYPTLLALTSSPKPDQPQDGLNLAPLLRDPAAPLTRDSLHWHLPHYHHSTPASAIRQGDWKLIEFFEDNHLELYNLTTDLGETTNLASKEPQRAESMRNALQTWRQSVNARMPEPNPAFDPARATNLGHGGGETRKKKKKP